MSKPTNFIARQATLVLELVTPLHIGSGERDGGSDAGVVRDFNGLPGIPGTSIQGMLRSAVEGIHGSEITRRIFGETGRANQGTGRGGRLGVSWGMIHGSDGRPVSGHLNPGERDRNDVLRDAARPMLRDHVRLTGRGVAAEHGKFDELVVGAGHRFTVRLRFVTAGEDDDADWNLLEAVLKGGGLRLGGKTRRGLGAFRIITWNGEMLKEPVSTNLFRTLDLAPETLWMFGGGTSDNADSAPVSGTRVMWDQADGRGRVEDVWILPGSGIKGPIRHRALFHANRLAGNWADDPDEAAKECADGWMDELFGFVRKKGARRGKVFIDDLFIPKSQIDAAPVQNHVAINPFTGGAKDSALFNDEPLPPSQAVPNLRVELRGEVPDKARQALGAALNDLATGRLALGAHAGRGYGWFRGSFVESPSPVAELESSQA